MFLGIKARSHYDGCPFLYPHVILLPSLCEQQFNVVAAGLYYILHL